MARHRDPIVLSGRRHWAGIWTGIAAMGAASGITMVAGGAWAGWFLVAVFGPCAAVLGMSLRPSANELVIDDDGYTIGSTFRRQVIAWSDVERIGVIDGAREPRVAVRFTASAAAKDRDSEAIAQALDGFHRTLPMSYGLDAHELARVMRAYAGLEEA